METLFRGVVLAALGVLFTGLTTAPSIFGESYGALVLGAVFAFGVWWVMFFGPPFIRETGLDE